MKNHISRKLFNALVFSAHSKALLAFAALVLVALNSSGQVYTNFFEEFEGGNLSHFTLFGAAPRRW